MDFINAINGILLHILLCNILHIKILFLYTIYLSSPICGAQLVKKNHIWFGMFFATSYYRKSGLNIAIN